MFSLRYFANDGSTTHGPATVDELIARPWFDGDMLVCPVGSQDSNDWKPALSYPAFKAALLVPRRPPEPAAPPPAPIPMPMPVLAPTPAPAPALAMAKCPHCGGENLARAHFCGDCGRRMDGTLPPQPREPVLPPVPAFEPPRPAAYEPPRPAAFETPRPAPVEPPTYDLPAHVEPPSSFAAPPAEEPPTYDLPPRDEPPAFEPPRFEPLRPMERRPERSGPMSRPLSPTGDAQAPVEHTFASLSSQMPHPLEPETSLAPETTPEPTFEPEAPAPVPVWKRPAAVAAFLGAAALSGAAAWMTLKPAPVAAPATGADLDLSAPASAPMSAGEPASMPISPAPAADVARPTPTPKAKPPRRKDPIMDQTAAPRPKRKRAPRPAPPPEKTDISDAILIESRAPDAEPGPPPGAPDEGGQPLSDPDSSPADFLPGIPRRPGLKAAKPKSAKRTVKAAEDSDTNALDAALAAPSEAAATGGGAAKAAAAAANPADALALQQAVEEFEFCVQLLSQGAYADHFDTCLCKETREKAPYRNRRGFYVSSLEKEAAAGRLEVKADIISTRMENGAARIVAKWKSRGNDPGREVDEAWIMDDGLWCKAP